jgi:hypothetical protein
MMRRRVLSRIARVAAWAYALVGLVVLALILVWVLAWSGLGRVS